MPDRLLDLDTYQRLKGAVRFSQRELRQYRTKRMEIISQYVGRHYSENGSTVRVPMNLIEIAINIYLRYLASHAPRSMVGTEAMLMKPVAYELELLLNQTNQEVDLEYHARMAVLDAMFCMGILMVGVSSGGYSHIGDEQVEVETPFADFVSMDDWVHDSNAKVLPHAGFMGNRFQVPYREVMESDVYDPRALEKLEPTEKGDDESGEDREEDLSHSNSASTDGDEFEEMVELRNLYLPQRKVFIVADAEMKLDRPLLERPWTGPKHGPYNILSFADVPGQIMPLAPGHLMMDLHDLANRLMRKLGRQAERQKTVLGYSSTAADDAKRTVDAEDGEAIKMDNPGLTRDFSFGGVDQRNLAFTMMLKDLFSYSNGGLETLGGLGTAAGTLGQEEIINQNASLRMQHMQGRVHNWLTRVQRSLAYYLWSNPVISKKLVKAGKNPGLNVPFEWTPDRRMGTLEDYSISIQPYSYAEQTPSKKLQTVTMFWERFVGPYLPLLQQAGVQPNVRALLRIVAKYAQMDELEELLIMNGGPPPGISEGGPAGSAPPVTKRTHERVNRGSSSTPEGKQAMMLEALLTKDMGSGSRNRVA
jgi:hypothetical protein